MKSRLLRSAVAVLLLGSLAAMAQDPAPAPSSNCLWRVKGKDTMVYLQGSIHFLKKESYPLNPAIEKAFESSQVVAFEVDLGAAESPATRELITAKAALPEGQTLKTVLNKETYQLASNQLAACGLDIQALQSLKPWMLSMTLIGVQLRKLGFDSQQGLDLYFHSRAKERRKETAALETWEFQLDLFDKMPYPEQDTLVRQTVEDMATATQDLDSLVKAWTSGRAAELDALLTKSLKDYPKLYQTIFVDRNQNWLKQIETFLAGKKICMVIVGAGHLVGKDGLVEALKQKGYKVEQL